MRNKSYKLLYETSNDALMTVEPPVWKFTSGNPMAIKMFNTKNEEQFITLAPGDLSPEKQPDGQLSSVKAKKMIDKAMKDGSNFFEWTHKRYKGENFSANVLLSRVKMDGKTYLQATVRDLTKILERRNNR
jgi:predicted aldo/keto reductase-like oxidoreductase